MVTDVGKLGCKKWSKREPGGYGGGGLARGRLFKVRAMGAYCAKAEAQGLVGLPAGALGVVGPGTVAG
jgi:hypothetical protein